MTHCDPRRATISFEEMCNEGNGEFCYKRARIESLGQDGPTNKEKARRLLGKGCSLKNAKACDSLATSWEYGVGGPQDEAKAKELRKKACDLGLQSACNAL